MKILHLNYFDINGGAARAAYRIHHALRTSGVDSTMFVNIAAAGDWTVESPVRGWHKIASLVRPQVGKLVGKLLRTQNPVIHSPAVLSASLVKRINQSDADVVHLHWICSEMLSVADIGRIQKPIVWTLHDMWAFCGAEHLAWDQRWREGYRRDNRPAHESGFDLNRWTWERKRKHWQRPMQIVTPSRWMGECVSDSALMKNWPVNVVPNCLDTEQWQPIPQVLARQLLGLPVDVPLVLFGTAGANADHNKGFDLMACSLEHLRGEIPGLELVILGQLAPRIPLNLGFHVHYTGYLHDDLTLRALYSAVNMLVIPSRIENLPNTGIEALACGTPVVAFDTGGMSDIVRHLATGYLAKAFDTIDMANGIKWILTDSQMLVRLGLNARRDAVNNFNCQKVANQYIAVYKQAQFYSDH
jgi:glycosyltransferase involved in cell wall biosynthesis